MNLCEMLTFHFQIGSNQFRFTGLMELNLAVTLYRREKRAHERLPQATALPNNGRKCHVNKMQWKVLEYSPINRLLFF